MSCDNACVNSKYACDNVFIPSPLRNNALAHSEYLKHLKNSLDMLREIIEESSKEKSHDTAISDIRFLTNRSQELVEYAIGTCPKVDNMRANQCICF